MKTLTNWKYEIAFNNDKYIDVKNYTLYLNHKEKQVMDMQIDFYRKSFSFDQLINKLRIVDEKKQTILINLALKNIKNILYTPSILKQHYISIINRDFNKYRTTLTLILNRSISKSGRVNPCKKLYKAILGRYYNFTKRKITEYSKRKVHPVPFTQKLTEFDYLREVKRMEKHMYDDKLSQGIFGKYTLYNTQFAYNNLSGQGSYTFSKVYGGDNDLFVINTNNCEVNLAQLHHMVYHNFYPGKGHMFNTVFTKSNTNCFDFGANYLINGWATFAMWHYNQTTFTNNTKVISSQIVKACMGYNFAKDINKLYLYLLGIMPKDVAQYYIIRLTQYPGDLESHVMGAIATEELINKGFASSPWNLLNTYKLVNLGDFFFEYTKGYIKNKKH